jgi:hypothetical protein
MLSAVNEESHGILSVVPKTKDGEPITDFEAQIIMDNSSGQSTEVKEWLAVAQYLKSFDKVNGTPQISEYYNRPQGRKIVEDNHNIFALMSKPNSIALTAYTIIIVIILLIIFILMSFIRRRKNRKIHINVGNTKKLR